MSAEYKYTQVGFVTIIMILLVGAFTWFIFDAAIKSSESQLALMLKVIGLVVAGFFVLVLAAFYSFTIQVAAGELSFWFGFGVARKSITLQDIHSVEVVKNPWYYFWGIKSTPGGWLFSIAPGGRAVELVVADGKLIRLCTNQLEELKQSLAEMVESVTWRVPRDGNEDHTILK